MKFSENWLKSHVKFSVDTEKLVDQLTMAGLEVDSVNYLGAISGVKIARIEKVEPHPNADKLKVNLSIYLHFKLRIYEFLYSSQNYP